MFKTRLLSGILLVVLLLLFIIPGNVLLLAGLTLLSIRGAYELYRVLGINKEPVSIVGYITILTYYLNLKFNILSDIMVLFMVMMVVLLFIFVLKYPKLNFTQLGGVVFGVFYVGIMLSYIYQLRMLEPIGAYVVWLIIISTWGCDTCAYCVGMLFGKHKMSPVLSPKKSVEGAIGGVVGAGLIALIYCLILKDRMSIDQIGVVIIVINVMIAALISMVGDLAASAIKRFYDIKDYGRLIPGHGGVLDRFDSVIICAPIIYYLVYYTIKFL